jgi:soluble lytic murein transglycosylase-like protein
VTEKSRDKRGVPYDWNRLVSDPVYNTQMGAGEVTALLKEYSGSYIMTFAGYNAGRGRVRQWVAQHGDPRDAKVDAQSVNRGASRSQYAFPAAASPAV